MGAVYRKTFTKPLPAGAEVFTRNGERFARWKNAKGKTRTAKLTAGKDGLDRIVLEAKTFTAKYRNGSNHVVETATGCRDETAARSVLGDLEQRGVLVKIGVITAAQDAIADHQPAPLTEHFDAYKTHLESVGTTPKYRGETLGRLRRVAADCVFTRLSDLGREAFECWLVQIGRPKQLDDKTVPGASARTRNAYREAVVAFGNWCVESNRLTVNPFAGIAKANQKADPRRQRRSMTEAELLELLDVARRRPLLDAMTVRRGKRKGEAVAKLQPETFKRLELLGRERALIYKMLLLTGLRLNELRSLTVGQLHLDDEMPYVTLDAADEKNRQGSALPIRTDLAGDLKDWVSLKHERFYGAATDASKGQTTGVIPMTAAPTGELPTSTPLFTVPKGLVRILDRDLKLAGIAKRDDRGRTLDVHALRHTFGTLLSKGGVTPRTAQAAMRHSSIDLTMNVYTDPKLLDVHGAMDSLPAMPLDHGHRLIREVAKATGTDDQPASTLAPVLALKSDVSRKSGSHADGSPLRDAPSSESRALDITSIVVRSSDSLISGDSGRQKSGRQDLNLRPSGPKPDALAKLSYAPELLGFSLGAGATGVNAERAGGVSPRIWLLS